MLNSFMINTQSFYEANNEMPKINLYTAWFLKVIIPSCSNTSNANSGFLWNSVK